MILTPQIKNKTKDINQKWKSFYYLDSNDNLVWCILVNFNNIWMHVTYTAVGSAKYGQVIAK